MRKDFGAKPFLFPQPVMMIGTYDADGKPNLMNAAWGGIVEMNQLVISLAPHLTTENIDRNKEYTVSMGVAEYAAACDYVGIVSGKKDPEKMKKSGFTTTRSSHVNAPLINELPVALECKLLKVVPDGLYFGEIVNVSIDESVLDENGKLSMEKFHPIVFETANHGYYDFGKCVGQAFKCGMSLK